MKRLHRLARVLVFSGLVSVPAGLRAEEVPRLEPLNADLSESSISGISSGAFMAAQFGTAWSSIIRGVGIVAGGPDWCAEGTSLGEMLGNLPNIIRATWACMKGPPPDLDTIYGRIDQWAGSGGIDDTKNLSRQKVYIFSGYNDTMVNTSVVDASWSFYRHYAGDANKGGVFYQNAVGAGHAQITLDYGLDCNANTFYFINDCKYDQAGILLQHIYGKLNPRNAAALTGQVKPFDQREFTAPAAPDTFGMAETGYVYIPEACGRKERCRIHVALHGCLQDAAEIGDRYTRHAGYLEWADTNHIVVLFPQTVATSPLRSLHQPYNPQACWDWWGYTGSDYAEKSGKQIAAIRSMLARLTRGAAPPAPISVPPDPGGPEEVVVNDVSDTAIALAWRPVAGAASYRIYRASPDSSDFLVIGTVAGPSFGDSGLTPQTTYRYKVAAITGENGEGQASAPVSQATRAEAKRCGKPGDCPL